VRVLVAFALAAVVGGCNTWTRYYVDALGVPVEDVPELEPYYGHPVVVCTEDIGVGIGRLRTAGFEPIGFSVFNDAEVIDIEGSIIQATQVSAAVVLIYTRYPFAFCGGMVQREGSRVVTSIATAPVVSLDVLAPMDPTTTGRGQAIVGYGEKYAGHDYVAAYFARRRALLGAILSDLREDDVYDLGARIDVVIGKSPFHRAGVLVGDIIVYVDKVEMLDTWHVTKTIREAEGPSVSIVVLREGARHELSVAVPETDVRRNR